LYNFFKYTKRKESKKDLRCWSSYISNPLVVVVYFTIHGTLIFLFIAQHVRNFDLKKREVARARKNLCITFAQDVSLPPHRQELIMKQ
jgi:undecaprenyl pyrophosphate phosphatase UppP